MAVQIEELNSALIEGLPAFNVAVWDFPHDQAFLRWFFHAPDTVVMVAHDDGRWLAALGVYVRRYLHENQPVDCFETFAWARLPTQEAQGLGIKLMKAFMRRGKPLVALGGSASTLDYMPRLGFKVIAHAPVLNLPLSAGAAAAVPGLKGRLARLGLTFLGPLLRPKPHASREIRLVPLSHLDLPTLQSNVLPGFQATYTVEFFRALTSGYSEVGTFLPFRFIRDGEIAGWAFARVAEERRGFLVGRLLETKFAPWTHADARRTMMHAVTASLAGFGVGIVRALTTCPDTIAALRALHFTSKSVDNPALVYPAGLTFGNEPVRISVLRADGGVLPLPPRTELESRAHA